MALQKATNFKGLVFEKTYWRVEFINHFSRPDRFAILEVWGYPNAKIAEQAKSENRSAELHIERKEIRLEGEQFDAFCDELLKMFPFVYDVVKSESEFFSDASDC